MAADRRTWTRREVMLAMGALPLAGLARAQGNEGWNETVKRATSDVKVVLYSVAGPEQNQRLVDAFEKQHRGIKLTVVRGAGELPPRIAAERGNNVDGADVFLYSDPLWFKQNAPNLLDINSPAVATWPSSHWAVPAKSPMVSYPPMGMLVWNTKMVPAGVKNYPDLLNPSFKGRIGTRQDMTAFLAAFLDWQEQAFGVDFMKKFGAQKPKYYPSVIPMTQAVASGEIWIANTSIPSIAKDLKKQGAPIEYVIPPKTFAIQWAAGALSASRRPNAARLFVNFLMSEPGQLALNGDGDGGSPLHVKGTLRPEDLTILELDKYDAARREEWRKKFKEYFG